MNVYKSPLYYEVAFSFVDEKKQVDLFETHVKEFSKIKIKRVLDVACGPGLQLRELAKRGYESVGLDNSEEMLQYLRQKTKEDGTEIETVKADMTDFLCPQVDFAFIMMGSFTFSSNQELLKHLDCVSRSLRKGGLYLIENMILDWSSFLNSSETWTMNRNGITVTSTYQTKLSDMISQTFEEKITLQVNDNGKKLRLLEDNVCKLVFPQEFLSLIELNGSFEFLGWFERFNFKPLKTANNDNIVALRKK
jgi:ubiquinone/menaquinone biosynthesis C-methylase UbiE